MFIFVSPTNYYHVIFLCTSACWWKVGETLTSLDCRGYGSSGRISKWDSKWLFYSPVSFSPDSIGEYRWLKWVRINNWTSKSKDNSATRSGVECPFSTASEAIEFWKVVSCTKTSNCTLESLPCSNNDWTRHFSELESYESPIIAIRWPRTGGNNTWSGLIVFSLITTVKPWKWEKRSGISI